MPKKDKEKGQLLMERDALSLFKKRKLFIIFLISNIKWGKNNLSIFFNPENEVNFFGKKKSNNFYPFESRNRDRTKINKN